MLRAWIKVKTAIRSVGAYDSIVFDDAISHFIIEEMQGWISLCQTIEEKLAFVGNEFQKRYCAYVINKPSVHPKMLAGIFENQALTYSDQIKPILFGDHDRAKIIFKTGQVTNLNNHAIKLSDLNKIEGQSNVEKQITV